MPLGMNPNDLGSVDVSGRGDAFVLSRRAGISGAPAEQVVVRRDLLRGSAIADAAGVAEVQLGPAPFDAALLVEHLMVSSTSGLATEVRVYAGDPVPTNLLDATLAGNLDSADYPAGLYLAGGGILRVRWSNATVGSECAVTAQVAEVR